MQLTAEYAEKRGGPQRKYKRDLNGLEQIKSSSGIYVCLKIFAAFSVNLHLHSNTLRFLHHIFRSHIERGTLVQVPGLEVQDPCLA